MEAVIQTQVRIRANTWSIQVHQHQTPQGVDLLLARAARDDQYTWISRTVVAQIQRCRNITQRWRNERLEAMIERAPAIPKTRLRKVSGKEKEINERNPQLMRALKGFCECVDVVENVSVS